LTSGSSQLPEGEFFKHNVTLRVEKMRFIYLRNLFVNSDADRRYYCVQGRTSIHDHVAMKKEVFFPCMRRHCPEASATEK